MNKLAKQVFQQYPQANWPTLCRITEWAKAKHKRFSSPLHALSMWRWAYADGYMPEFDNQTDAMTAAIIEALQMETHEGWCTLLDRAQGSRRKEVLAAWMKWRQEQSLPVPV